MNRLWLAAVAGAFWASAAAARDLTTAPRYGAWGYDLSARDLGVRPGDDFFRYAEGRAVDAMRIPPDRSRYGAFDVLAELSAARSRAVIETAAADPSATEDEAKVGAFYRAFMDEGRIEALGARPLQPELDAVRAAGTHSAIAALMGRANLGFGSGLFDPYITPDPKAPKSYVVRITQAGLGLRDRDYYLKPAFASYLAKYRAYVARMLGLIGWPDPEANAKALLAFETQIAKASWPRAEARDEERTYNPTTLAALQASAPGFDWTAFLQGAELSGVQRLIVDENTAAPKIAAVFARTPIPVLQAWLAFRLADGAAPCLSKPFVDAHFELWAHTLSGQPEPKPRWKRAVALVGDRMGEAVGRLYVEAYFPPEAKARMQQLVAALQDALRARIQALDWMSDKTKAEALAKLARLRVKIGYPDRWRDYSGLVVTPDDLYGDFERGVAFEWRRQVRRLGQPVDQSEWDMTPQTINAYYSQAGNEIVFPAAILQPPFFDPDADMAVNFGAIGAVIGHELIHGFDDEGRKSDGEGLLRSWWTRKDIERFHGRARAYGAEFAAFDVLPDVPGAHVDPDQTIGENIADLGGLILALDAYHAFLRGQPAPVIDGLTGDQRLFLSWAQVWRSRSRDEAARQELVYDAHAPARARVDIPLRNLDAWYSAFDVRPGDKLYLPPGKRVRIW